MKQTINATQARIVRHLQGAGASPGLSIGKALEMPRGSIFVTLYRAHKAGLVYRDDDLRYGVTPFGSRELATYDKVRAIIEARR